MTRDIAVWRYATSKSDSRGLYVPTSPDFAIWRHTTSRADISYQGIKRTMSGYLAKRDLLAWRHATSQSYCMQLRAWQNATSDLPILGVTWYLTARHFIAWRYVYFEIWRSATLRPDDAVVLRPRLRGTWEYDLVTRRHTILRPDGTRLCSLSQTIWRNATAQYHDSQRRGLMARDFIAWRLYRAVYRSLNQGFKTGIKVNQRLIKVSGEKITLIESVIYLETKRWFTINV